MWNLKECNLLQPSLRFFPINANLLHFLSFLCHSKQPVTKGA